MARSVICIKNNTKKSYAMDVGVSDPFLKGNPFWEGRDISFPLVGNKPGSNLDDKILPPGRHVCKKQEINVDGIEKSNGYDFVLVIWEPTAMVRNSMGVLNTPSPDLDGHYTYNGFDAVAIPGNKSVHWKVTPERGSGAESQWQTDEGFLYSTEFVNIFGEIRETEACPAPYKRDKDCQLFEILN